MEAGKTGLARARIANVLLMFYFLVMTDCDSTDPLIRLRGRGATRNPAGRFERESRHYISEDWQAHQEQQAARTRVALERPRRMISYNRSPDLPFDRSINPYRGCEHGCIYCFARPSHAYLGLSPGLDFETRLVARPEAAQVLARELRRPRYEVRPIAIGTNTDPYQPVEKTYEITRSCLKVLRDFNHPVAIVTKGSLIERDLDILSEMALRGLVRVGVSLITLDPELSRRLEPRAPAPARRLAMIRALSAAGVPVRVMTSPVIPALTDPELEALLQAGATAGADAASWIMLRLPREVSGLFQNWLAQHCPDRAERVMGHIRAMHGGKDYDASWGRRMRGEGPYAALIADRFRLAAQRLSLDAPQPPLRCDLFAPPARQGDQLALF